MKQIFTILFLLFSFCVHAQIDSVRNNQAKIDTNNSANISVVNDSLKQNNISSSNVAVHRIISENYIVSSIRKKQNFKTELSFFIPDWFYYKGVKQSADIISIHTESNAGDIFFYCLLMILFLVGMVKFFFPKYFNQIFQFILQPRVRRKNFRESGNSENIVPSILMNFLFVITSSLCIVQLTKKNFSIDNDWKFWLYDAIIIASIYLIKFIVIKISGWIFNASYAASTYNYVVFTINKILGVVLIPIIILAAYGSNGLVSFIYSASSVVVVLLLVYRYIASFILIRGNLQVSIFYFFIYLCAIEILPLLILYKVLMMNFGNLI